jgi:Protein of unknown function (DUF2628)
MRLMRFWTAHMRAGVEPVLVREGFSWGAFFLGPLWLAAHRVWIGAVLALVATGLIVVLTEDFVRAVLIVGLMLLFGLSGYDLRRWSLDHRGYLLSQVLSARDETEALARLLERRPDLGGSYR